MSEGTPALPSLLVETRDDLAAFVRRHAAGLLRFETADDLVQAVHVRALESEAHFSWRGREPFFAWLYTVARRELSDRRAHWAALKRGSGDLLRLTEGAAGTSGTADPRAVAAPPAKGSGPSTFADRREQLVRVIRTLDALLPRDRDLVRWTAEGVDLAEQAERLGISYDAVERARARALDRFRKAFTLASR